MFDIDSYNRFYYLTPQIGSTQDVIHCNESRTYIKSFIPIYRRL